MPTYAQYMQKIKKKYGSAPTGTLSSISSPKLKVKPVPQVLALSPGGRKLSSSTVGAQPGSRVEQAAAVARQINYGQRSQPGARFSTIQRGAGYTPPEVAQAAATAAYGGGSVPTYGADGGISPIHKVKWKEGSFDLQGANAPSWWKPLVPKDAKDAERPDVQFLMMLNTMIPYLSPEDQRNAASQIYAAAADAFSYYKPEKISIDVPVSQQTANLSQQPGLTPVNEQYFQSAGRATGAIDALSQLRAQTVKGNRWKLAPGYTWLQQVLGAAGQYGGSPGAGQTRSQFLAMQGALDPLLAQSGTAELGGVGAIGRLFAQPFFSQTQLRPTSQGPGGQTFFGKPTGLLAF